MPVSAKKIKGKLKRDIAFQKLGPNATIPQIDTYKHYKLQFRERSMYWRYKREAPLAPLRRYPKSAAKKT